MAVSSGSLNTPKGTLSVSVDVVEVTDMQPRPDKSWRYTDKQGHEHYYDGYPVPYPTLTHVLDETYWCQDCRDDHTDGHLECRICGEHINPGLTGPSAFREYVPGLRHYKLDGVEITEERFTELLAQYRPPVS
jgi:hypothetical protein